MFFLSRDFTSILHSIKHNMKENMDFMGSAVWSVCLAACAIFSLIMADINFLDCWIKWTGLFIGSSLMTIYALYLAKRDYKAVI